MIRSAILSLALLPAFAAAATAPCGTPMQVPMPASVPATEMLHSAPAMASCVNLLSYLQRLRQPVAAPSSASGTAYVPKTANDNTPWRFDMNQNGRRMTSSEFDAWMKAKGIRVATGRAGMQAAPAAPAATVAPAAGSQ